MAGASQFSLSERYQGLSDYGEPSGRALACARARGLQRRCIRLQSEVPMLYLQLRNILPGRPLVLGPAPWFQISGNEIRQGPHGETVAEYLKNSWFAKGQYFTSMLFRERACVHFEDFSGVPTAPMGPFNDLQVADGLMRSSDGPVATLQSESQLWHCPRMANAWPFMMIKPALP